MSVDWNERWRSNDTPWEKGYAAPPLTEYLAEDGLELRKARRVLVPGCGSGHDVRELARHGIPATGLDISEKAVEVARAVPRVGEEDYFHGDLFDPSWKHQRPFDTVWEHTCFCAIDPSMRPAYAEAMAGILPPGGFLTGVFYLTPWDPGEVVDSPPYAASREEIIGLFAPWFDLRKDRVPGRAYPGREGREWLAIFERRK